MILFPIININILYIIPIFIFRGYHRQILLVTFFFMFFILHPLLSCITCHTNISLLLGFISLKYDHDIFLYSGFILPSQRWGLSCRLGGNWGRRLLSGLQGSNELVFCSGATINVESLIFNVLLFSPAIIKGRVYLIR